MSLDVRLRRLALPLLALALVAIVLVVQVANGGGGYAPNALADPCAARSATSTPATLDALGQELVLLGLDGAACRLGTSREALTLDLAQHHDDPSDAQVAALKAGLLDAVARMKSAGTLPPSADLIDQALDASDLNSLAKLAIRALPDSIVDRALPTDEVLRQAIENLDVRSLLTGLDDSDHLGDLVTRAVVKAAEQTITAKLRGLV
ncbi:hypothetical protein P5P86_15540 [Nocardioides sp. BP30]|uniref:hypothetical protein n=1 Tax=Nocardioides sp. BP30 TaxID=3036374 RepID=UPI0024689A12|nr:hypothetical protein [Nocardioides sp. BP30]WGL51367.1 hypothetical protein P5P86_15540 [Nocardioides sp. BP30]